MGENPISMIKSYLGLFTEEANFAKCGVFNYLYDNCDETLSGTNGEGYRGCQTKSKSGYQC